MAKTGVNKFCKNEKLEIYKKDRTSAKKEKYFVVSNDYLDTS